MLQLHQPENFKHWANHRNRIRQPSGQPEGSVLNFVLASGGKTDTRAAKNGCNY